LEFVVLNTQAKTSPVKTNPCYKMSFIGQNLVVCLITKMSDDSCIWCHAPVRPRQEAVEWYSYKMASQIGKCGNMGYVQYNYDAGTSLQWYECTVVGVDFKTFYVKNPGRFAPITCSPRKVSQFAPLNGYIIIDEIFFDNFLVIIYLLVVCKKKKK
jgi:hypothetical protein